MLIILNTSGLMCNGDSVVRSLFSDRHLFLQSNQSCASAALNRKRLSWRHQQLPFSFDWAEIGYSQSALMHIHTREEEVLAAQLNTPSGVLVVFRSVEGGGWWRFAQQAGNTFTERFLVVSRQPDPRAWFLERGPPGRARRAPPGPWRCPWRPAGSRSNRGRWWRTGSSATLC